MLQDTIAVRQQLTDNVQVLINHHTHLKDKRHSSIFKKMTKIFKSEKPEKTKLDKNGRYDVQVSKTTTSTKDGRLVEQTD